MKMIVSESGLQNIKDFEGFRTKAYQDSGGQWTIGFGTSFFPDGRAVKSGDTISESDAENALREGVQSRLDSISSKITTTLNQNQVDAIASFVYNIGVANFLKSTFLVDINARNFNAAALQLVHRNADGSYGGWVHVHGKVEPGLVKRRVFESNLLTA